MSTQGSALSGMVGERVGSTFSEKKSVIDDYKPVTKVGSMTEERAKRLETEMRR